MVKSYDETETLGLTGSKLIFSSRSVRNTTISLISSTGELPVPVYVIETPNSWKDLPNTIYKIGNSEQKEQLAMLGWKAFNKDWIDIRGERKMLKDVLPTKGFLR